MVLEAEGPIAAEGRGELLDNQLLVVVVVAGGVFQGEDDIVIMALKS